MPEDREKAGQDLYVQSTSSPLKSPFQTLISKPTSTFQSKLSINTRSKDPPTFSDNLQGGKEYNGQDKNVANFPTAENTATDWSTMTSSSANERLTNQHSPPSLVVRHKGGLGLNPVSNSGLPKHIQLIILK